MMNCWRARPLLTALLDEELSPSEAESVRRHLDACNECAALLDRLDRVPPIEAPVLDRGLEARLWEELDLGLEAARSHAGATKPRFREPPWWVQALDALRFRQLTLPMPVVATYAAAALLLLGWSLFSFQRVQVLDAQVQAKDDMIRLLQSPMHARAGEVVADPELPSMPPANSLPGMAPVGGVRAVSTGAAELDGRDEASAPQGYYNLVH